MKNLTIVNQYDDSKLQFNKEVGRYELTLEVVKANFDNNFQDDGILERRIKKNSRKVYNYIFNRSYSSNRSVITFLLNKTQEGRQFIFEVLMAQMEADIDSGYNDLTMTPAINVSNGQTIDRNALRENELCIDAENIIDSSVGFFGINIMYRSIFPTSYFLLAMKGK